MNKTHMFDDISLVKNELQDRLSRELRLFTAVCVEDGLAKHSPSTHRHLMECNRRRWRNYASLSRLLALKETDWDVKSQATWSELLPNLAGIDTQVLPADTNDRQKFWESVATTANQVRADLLFCDLSTGLSKKDGEQVRSPMHIFSDELRYLFDTFKGSLAIYQHHRQGQSWPSIIGDYHDSLARRNYAHRCWAFSRARIIVILKPIGEDTILQASQDIAEELDLRFLSEQRTVELREKTVNTQPGQCPGRSTKAERIGTKEMAA